VTSLARTILDCAPRLQDRLTRTVNDALHSPYVSESKLAAVITRYPNHPGSRLVAPHVHVETGRTRSVFEDRFREFCGTYGLPSPEFNVPVQGHLVDAFFRTEGVIVECDSWEFHRLRGRFEDDRDRDLDHAAAGNVPVRLTWRRLERDPEREAQRLCLLLARRRAIAQPD
jgi:hypothetical protein